MWRTLDYGVKQTWLEKLLLTHMGLGKILSLELQCSASVSPLSGNCTQCKFHWGTTQGKLFLWLDLGEIDFTCVLEVGLE